LKTIQKESSGEEEWAGNFLLSLAKAENFEMTMMMVEDDEKEII